MSGNYDYPPASRYGSEPPQQRQRPNEQPNVILLHNLRNLLNSGRSPIPDTARALETLDQELAEYRLDRLQNRSSFEEARAAVDRQIQQLQSDLSGREERIRNILRDHEPSHSHSTTMNQEPSSPETPRSVGRASRRRAVRGERSGRDGRTRDSATNNSLLDEPVPRFDSSAGILSPDTDRWRIKRRKIDSDDYKEGSRELGYGQYGQVVPGALKMEIASCDGGTYEPEGASSWPQNVLRNDSSVYCTKSDRCNLILKHRGDTPFCLKKIVIKAPKSGYDAPIQEGMVFVSMTSDELLTRTAQYQIQYSSARRRRRNRRNGMLPSEETVLAGPDSHSASDNDFVTAQPAAGNDSIGEFRLTIDYDENSERSSFYEQENDDQALSVAEIERLQTAQMEQMEDDLLCSDSGTSESDDDTAELSTFNRRRRDLQRRMRAMRRQYAMEQRELQRQRQAPSLIEPAAPPPPAAPAPPQSSDPTQRPEVLRPHARFFIERAKSMVSIKFDPPPSGRYILIKLWSPHSGGNIDIQSIIVHGFAGPRYFPAGGFR